MPDGSVTNFSRKKPTTPRNAKAAKKPQFLDGVGFLGGLLGQSAGLFVGATALTYFFGWRVQTAYYVEMGAPWIVETLPPFSFLMAGAILSFMTFTGLLVGVPLIQQSGRTKSVTYLNCFLCVLALAFMFVGDFSFVSEVQALKFGPATTMLFSCRAG